MRTQAYPGYFITLTYHPKYVKRVKDALGVVRLSLRFKDTQLWFKRIRKAKYYCKYVCVGEYGTQTKRPHYHVMLWTDAPVEFLEKEWYLGMMHVGTLEMASAMYSLKYIIQPKQVVEGLERPRAQFSQGIGLAYMTTEVYNWHTQDYDDPRFHSYIDGKTVALPRYYRNKIFTKEQCRRNCEKVKWEQIRKHRQLMRDLIAQGVKGSSAFIQRSRVLEAENIQRKVKHNTHL